MTLPSIPYESFLRSKAIVAKPLGVEIDEATIHPALKFHQKKMVAWLCRMGRAACFSAFGTGKTLIQLETVRQVRNHAGGMALIVCPLGVRGEFVRDGALIGITPKFVRSLEECDDSEGIYLANYETIRDGKLDPKAFSVTSLDEAAVLRGFGSTLTFREFMRVFEGVRYKFIATATPSPNEFIELLAYSAYLEVMEVGEAKTRFFKRDSTKADKLTLHAHKEREFWLWVSSWALFVQRPSDIGGDDTGYILPDLNIHWHEIPAEHGGGQKDEHGQGLLFDAQAMGLQGAAREKRESLGKRVDKLAELINNELRKSANLRGFGNALQRSSGSERIPENLLSEESFGAIAETESFKRDDDGGGDSKAQGIHAGVSSEIPSREQTKKIGTVEGVLSSEQGDIRTKIEGVEGQQSRSIQGVDKELFCEKRGQGQGKKCSLVQGEQEQGVSDSKSQQAETLRNIGGGVSEETGKTGICLRDLQGTSCAGNITKDSESGSLPRNRGSKGSPLQQVQHGTRSARRHTCENHVSSGLSDQVVVWCDLNSEQDAITRRLAEEGISSSSLYGSQPIDDREELMNAWRDKRTSAFISKPRMYGSGVNMQQCHTMVFVGINYKASDFLQAIHRIHRFKQSHDCDVHIIYTENERHVRQILEMKWAQHITLTRNMSGIIQEFGLDNLTRAEAMARAMGVDREEMKNEHFHVIHNDTVLETRAMDSNSVGLILTSIPFSTQYEYSPNYADFGHSDSNEHFFEQMDYLTPELLRVLKPGRMAVIHVKDRVVPGGMTGLGFQTVYPFHARCIEHYTRHGFGYMGMKTIVTDVVRENNQTYRLGWTEQCKDATKMGVGMPEYLLMFRKPQTDTTRSYTDDPVTKDKPLVFASNDDRDLPWEERKKVPMKQGDKRPCVRGTGYSRARWQIDAHGFARSSGDRFPTTEEIRNMPHEAIFKAFRKYGLENVYEYEQHVGIGEDMEEDARLPVTFMLLQPPSWNPDVWTDVARMRCLNGEQKHKGKQMHLCPMQFDIADRVINQLSATGDIVFDPFGGLMTVPYRAIKHGRYGLGVELSKSYYLDGLYYCQEAVKQRQQPTLFDFLDAEEELADVMPLEEAA